MHNSRHASDKHGVPRLPHMPSPLPAQARTGPGAGRTLHAESEFGEIECNVGKEIEESLTG